MTNALIVLADGFEEIEAITCIDILRRARINVTLAGLENLQINAGHGLKVIADVLLSDVKNTGFDVLVLPGGEPGTTNLQKSLLAAEIIKTQNESNRLVAALCAAPRILDAMGILSGKRATSFPGTRAQMMNCDYVDEDVVVTGNIVTSRGPGTAAQFAFKLVEILVSSEASEQIKRSMLFKR
ncbi:DJ-1 family glyoxalase III [Thermoproteota archaeon]